MSRKAHNLSPDDTSLDETIFGHKVTITPQEILAAIEPPLRSYIEEIECKEHPMLIGMRGTVAELEASLKGLTVSMMTSSMLNDRKRLDDLKRLIDMHGTSNQCLIKFSNGLGASILTGRMFYSTPASPYELGVLGTNDQLLPLFNGDDVRGRLTEAELIAYLKEIASYGRWQVFLMTLNGRLARFRYLYRLERMYAAHRIGRIKRRLWLDWIDLKARIEFVFVYWYWRLKGYDADDKLGDRIEESLDRLASEAGMTRPELEQAVRDAAARGEYLTVNDERVDLRHYEESDEQDNTEA